MQGQQFYPKLAALIAVVFWGTNYIVTTQLVPEHPLFIGAVRSLGGALPLLFFSPALPSTRWLGKIIILGTLNCGAFFGLLFLSALRLPGGIAGTLQSLGPLFTILIAWPLLGDRPTPIKFGIVLAGALGVSLLLSPGAGTFDLLGVIAGLAAAACLAIGGVLLNKWPRPAPLLIFTAWQLVVGGCQLALLALIVGDLPSQINGSQAGGLVYLAIASTTVAYSLWFYSVETAGASSAAPFLLLSPVVAFTLDAIFRGIVPTFSQAIGATIVLASLLVGQLRR